MRDALSLTDPDGNVTQWSYNNDGQETAESTTVPGDSGGAGTASESFTRDLDGNLTTLVDYDSRTTNYGYDLFSLETGETWYTSADTLTNTIGYTYNVLQQMTGGSETYADISGGGSYGVNSSLALVYNLAGNETGETQSMAGRANVVLSEGYDYNGNRTSLGVSIGGTGDLQNNYTYDHLQEMTGIEQTGQDPTDFSGGANTVAPKYAALEYNAAGLVTSVNTYAATSADSDYQVMHEAIAYNGDSQVTDLTYTANSAGSALLAGYHYGYDYDGLVSDLYSYSDTLDTADLTSSYSTWAHAQYGYDGRQQLGDDSGGGYDLSGGFSAVYTNWANAPTTDNWLYYDVNGNRTESGSSDETTAPGNRLTFDGEYYYLYDQEGNRTARFKSTHDALDSSATDITIYGWDNRNRMTSLTHYATYSDYTTGPTAADMAVSYQYDALDRETEEDETVGGSLDERFVWDGSSPLEVLDSGDNVVERYLNGPAVDQVLAVEEVSSPLVSGEGIGGTNPGVNWQLANAQGTVRDVVRATAGDSGGLSVAAIDHVFLDAYGLQYSPQSNSDAQEQTTVGFTGLRYDTLSGFYMSDTREYDPATGNWIQPNPSGLGPDSNPYRYVGNSPTNGTDPTGLDEQWGAHFGSDYDAFYGVGSSSGNRLALPTNFGPMQDRQLAAYYMRQWLLKNTNVPEFNPNGSYNSAFKADVVWMLQVSGGSGLGMPMNLNKQLTDYAGNERRATINNKGSLWTDFKDYLAHPSHMGGWSYYVAVGCWGTSGVIIGGLSGAAAGYVVGAIGAEIGLGCTLTSCAGSHRRICRVQHRRRCRRLRRGQDGPGNRFYRWRLSWMVRRRKRGGELVWRRRRRWWRRR